MIYTLSSEGGNESCTHNSKIMVIIPCGVVSPRMCHGRAPREATQSKHPCAATSKRNQTNLDRMLYFFKQKGPRPRLMKKMLYKGSCKTQNFLRISDGIDRLLAVTDYAGQRPQVFAQSKGHIHSPLHRGKSFRLQYGEVLGRQKGSQVTVAPCPATFAWSALSRDLPVKHCVPLHLNAGSCMAHAMVGFSFFEAGFM